jgi:phage terminase small subunit
MLTANQERFVQCIIEGMSQSDAYRSAYSTKNMSDKTIWESASKLMKTPKVSARLQELRNEIMTPAVMSAQERLKWLTELVNSDEETTADKLKACEIMNKMTGEYVQKVVADVDTTYSINIDLVDDDE